MEAHTLEAKGPVNSDTRFTNPYPPHPLHRRIQQQPFVTPATDTATNAVTAPKHYTAGGIQPIDYVTANSLPFSEGNVVKYITRHTHKNGAEDVMKAMQYCRFILEKTYGRRVTLEFPKG